MTQTIQLQQRIWRQQASMVFAFSNLARFFVPLLISIVLILVLLRSFYALALQFEYDIGSSPVPVTGMYDAEANDNFSYAYTRGNTALHIPQVGDGQFSVGIRMGGPREQAPTAARLTTPELHVDLRTLQQLRVYHLLVPTDERSDLQFHVQSTTTQVPGDGRELGAIVDWIQVRSVGSRLPPMNIMLSVPLFLLLFWSTILQLNLPYRHTALGLLMLSVVSASYVMSRGNVVLQPWWFLVAGVWTNAVISLSRLTERPFVSPLIGVVTLFVAWRVVLWIIGGVGVWYSDALYSVSQALTYAGGTIGERQYAPFIWQSLATGWFQWDSNHYELIALGGYSFTGIRPNIAFFPLYPLLTRMFLPMTGGNVVLAALLVSHLAMLGALLLLYDLVTHDFGSAVAYRTIFFLLLFPTSLFFAAAYTESLALLFAIAALWAMRRERWWLAGTAGFLLALTRLPGVLIAPVLALAYLQHHQWRWRAIRIDFLSVALPPAGLAVFMIFQWWRSGTPFAFLIAQQGWDNRLSPPWVLPQRLLSLINSSPDWPLFVFQAGVWISFIVLTLLALQRLPWLYGLTMLLLLLPPYLSNWPYSLSRHVLMGFPAFIVIGGLAKHIWVRRLIIGITLPLLIVSVLLFINGFWLA